MSRFLKSAGEKAHERSIRISTCPVDDSYMVVEGELIDDRIKDYYLVTGEKRPSGKIHHMVVRLLIRINDMLIDDVEVEMLSVPRDECSETLNSLDIIKGLRITRGFSSEIRSLLGGTKGCTHLVTLLTSMAPAALQGLWAYKSQKPVDSSVASYSDDRDRIEKMSGVLINSCYVWREDGPACRRLRDAIEKLDEKMGTGKP
ncbi:MAG: DUF2889 domain-containing protein [Spirochaetes bacterium]|jgi:hypothetical protein|nr:DUF2889 domain-containing protein [Spirochaetota bacterium]